MQRILSTYLFVNRKLTAELLGELARAGASAIELFCSRGHFDYRSSDDARELGSWLSGNHLTLHSIHSPTNRDFQLNRDSGAPLSIIDPERLRRQEAVDEIKRALDLVEQIPFRYCIQHVARQRDVPDERKWDAAFSSLEHLSLFARQRGVTLAIENTPGEMATPVNLKNFLEQTRLSNVKLCFDAGHAHLEGGAQEALESVRDLVVTTHMHDNRGERDDHLLPYEGTIDWSTMLAALPDGVPLVLELKEPAAAAGSSEVQAFAETLRGVQPVFDKFEEERAEAN
ncbi:MAG TPA: sugar phosphate isomerase/epimerase family protein [Candidatus Saccharimonadales bacterium]|jgi:sugar phosphate isomerase/epimerase|nr:sugar phosphate isomerase/epimerase family protein [Candidatus Saccharimonadales bacterium]